MHPLTVAIFVSACIFPYVYSTTQPRHIVHLLYDDIGWSDIWSTNGQFPTPFIDKLRSKSVILNRHYIHYVCSVSRSQFLTGRRSTNLGYGKLEVFKFTQIVGIPIGQPTIANWLRDFGNQNTNIKYKTYGVGKWHLGYSSELQTPFNKGFDHYYGFYQCGINYKSKMHYHAKDIWHTQNQSQYDFFEDENYAYSAVNVSTNTMILYDEKIDEYLNDFNRVQTNNPKKIMNLYLYIGVQTLHGPLQKVRQYTDECISILSASGVEYSSKRLRVCEYTFMTDNFMKNLVHNLKSYNLWDDTLLIFSSDNGAETDVATCNYPLRGPKFTHFDGNMRTITFVAGGNNVIKQKQYGTIRESLMSNMDWTPTLLSYSGILPYIDKKDYEWDGVNQWDMIQNGDKHNAQERDNLLISINSPDISSMSSINSAVIIFKYTDNHLYKYIIADLSKNGVDTHWIQKETDGWCIVDFETDRSISVKLRKDAEWKTSSAIKNSQFLFDLTDDEGEKFNLMRLNTINGDQLTNKKRKKIIKFAKKLIKNEINDVANKDYYHQTMDCLWDFQPEGNPWNFRVHESGIEGVYVSPFLKENQYKSKIKKCFNDMDKTKYPIPTGLRHLYLNKWLPPNPIVKSSKKHHIYLNEEEMFVNENKKNNDSNGWNKYIRYILGIFICIIIVVNLWLCGSIIPMGKQKHVETVTTGKNEYQPLLITNSENEHEYYTV